jgi:hypothetical protein
MLKVCYQDEQKSVIDIHVSRRKSVERLEIKVREHKFEAMLSR